ncbi:hypothetical protein FPSE_04081 [Fusarium pseudograminearum CS3096]|uniref:Uncharacterized protein n=1 Tax=Fusarium pseudograminearum (strain CS3096) TaxID=1028729 RepID=K3UTT0_FUSPC|nr:hypothetical protein FPSE_04081 [Fusarium pseudograminearum CS3096]EKJ75901.1 hypothetical protein FPSE_04081 [Fusarium pseudograminearum CS3096]KAF0637814.1 hypothetical protein FPSE5266_04081 [Fusarium pseudograminearum]
MQTKSFFTTLLALLPAVQAFEFTGPDPSVDLDFRKEITITWNGKVGKDVSPKLDLEWYAEPDKLHKIGSEITRNVADVYLSDRQYKVKFGKNTNGLLRPYAKELAADKLFSFRAIFRDGEEDVTYYSQNYTVVGLE